MKRLGIAFAILIACVVLYRLKYPTYTYRYRMTVNVEVDGEMRSGSSVIEVRVTEQPAIIINPISTRTEGEAVFVDLGGQRSLVALLASGDYALDQEFPNYVVPLLFRSETNGRLASIPSLRGKRELGGKDLPTPTLVTFSDANNSATLKVVRPEQLERAFGSNVHWRGVVIEMTTDPVTHGLEARLPFLVLQRDVLRDPLRDSTKFVPKYGAFLRS